MAETDGGTKRGRSEDSQERPSQRPRFGSPTSTFESRESNTLFASQESNTPPGSQESNSTSESEESNTSIVKAVTPVLRRLDEFAYNVEDNRSRAEECFHKYAAGHNLLGVDAATTSSTADHKSRGLVLKDLCCQDTVNYTGTVDRFANRFLPALCGHRNGSSKDRDATWMEPFLAHAHSRGRRWDFGDAHVIYESNMRAFVKPVENKFASIFAKAIDHHFNHFVAHGSQCKHLLAQDGCPGDAATSTDHRVRGSRSDQEWAIERMVLYQRAAVIVEHHSDWSEYHERGKFFCHEQGIEPSETNLHPCHALMADLAQLRPINGIQKDSQVNNGLIRQLAIKDEDILRLRKRVEDLSHLVPANQRLKSQVVFVQARALFEQLSARTLPSNPKDDSSSSRWKKWVADAVEDYSRMQPRDQQAHPFHNMLVEGKFKSTKVLQEWLETLYSAFSDEVHGIETRLLIDESVMHKRREKILLLAMDPTNFGNDGEVDIVEERNRYRFDKRRY